MNSSHSQLDYVTMPVSESSITPYDINLRPTLEILKRSSVLLRLKVAMLLYERVIVLAKFMLNPPVSDPGCRNLMTGTEHALKSTC